MDMHLLDRQSLVGLFCMHYLTWKRASASAGEIAGEGGLDLADVREALRLLWRGGFVNGGEEREIWWISYDPVRTTIADILVVLRDPAVEQERSLTGRFRQLFDRLFIERTSGMWALEVFAVKPGPIPCLQED